MMHSVENSGVRTVCRVALTAAACALIGVVCALLWWHVRPAIDAWGAAPARLQAALNAVPSQVVAQVLPVVSGAVSAADKRLAEAVQDANARLDQAIRAADGRLGQGLTTADARLGEVTATAEKLRGDVNAELVSLNSTVAATAAPIQAITKDAQDSWDDLYDDVRGTVASSTVAVTSVAQASMAVRDAAPAVASSVVSTSGSFAGIAADVKREVDEATKPKKWWQKILGPVYTIARIVGIFA